MLKTIFNHSSTCTLELGACTYSLVAPPRLGGSVGFGHGQKLRIQDMSCNVATYIYSRWLNMGALDPVACVMLQIPGTVLALER
jgi:hypothetical protein